jgi:hypothetical protein
LVGLAKIGPVKFKFLKKIITKKLKNPRGIKKICCGKNIFMKIMIFDQLKNIQSKIDEEGTWISCCVSMPKPKLKS